MSSQEFQNELDITKKKDSSLKRIFSRLKKFGIKKVFLSWDFYVGIIAFIILIFLYFYLGKTFQLETSKSLLEIIINITGCFFALVLAAFSIIFAFSNEDFLIVWRKIGHIDNIVILYQYNLLLSLIILIFAFIIRYWLVDYQFLIIIAITLFIYLIASLAYLTNFTCNYALLYSEYLEIEDNKKNQDDLNGKK